MFLVKLILKCGSSEPQSFKPWCKPYMTIYWEIFFPFSEYFFLRTQSSVFHFLVNILINCRKQVEVSLLYKLEERSKLFAFWAKSQSKMMITKKKSLFSKQSFFPDSFISFLFESVNIPERKFDWNNQDYFFLDVW